MGFPRQSMVGMKASTQKPAEMAMEEHDLQIMIIDHDVSMLSEPWFEQPNCKKTFLRPLGNLFIDWTLNESKDYCWQCCWSTMCTCVLSRFTCVQLFVTPWTVAPQAPLFMGFSRQDYCSGLPCPPLGDLPNPRIKPTSFIFSALASGFFPTSVTWEAC